MSTPREYTYNVLVVDDDPFGLTFFRSSLEMSGYQVTVARSVREAKAKARAKGLEHFDAVVTDFRMPGETGIDLLGWVRENDETLSTIIVTAQGEKDLVKQALSGGAAEFLEKPITHQGLREAVVKAAARTQRQRRFHERERGLLAAGQLDRVFNTAGAIEGVPHAIIRYNPLQEIGGDFVNTFEVNPGKFVLLVGDVSGHDIKAAFVSAYFQGLVRGTTLSQHAPFRSLLDFNELLCRDWNNVRGGLGDLPTSLALSMAEVDLGAKEMRLVSCGFPPPMLGRTDGSVEFGTIGLPPLGWNAEQAFDPQIFALSEAAFLVLYTDGLIEFANELEISFAALLYTLVREEASLAGVSLRPSDDILVLFFKFDPKMALPDTFMPILNEQYSGAEVAEIDRMQAIWRRSLQFALGEQLGERLFDLLTCIREGMLNALIHGCDRSAEKVAVLQISYNENLGVVRVRIDDPGRGHRFDLKTRLRELIRPSGEHLGLGIIDHLSDSLELLNQGSSLVFDFHLKDPPKP